jgi:hypothetical protein
MRTGKLMLAILMILGLAVAANAMDKDEALHGPTGYVPEQTSPLLITGADCTDPIVISSLPANLTGQTNCGMGNTYSATCLGSYDGGEDVMYRLDLAVETTIDIALTTTSTWTGMLLDDSCPPDAATCIAIATGSGGNKAINDRTLAAGSYWIMIDTWPTPNCIPTFALSITEDVPPPPPPANNVCDGAIDLQSLESNVFTVDLCAFYTNSYDAGAGGCTGYASAGNDATYKVYLAEGESFTASMVSAHDSSIWLVTDCTNAAATCVAGADATVSNGVETITYSATAAGWYYLIIDGYGLGACNVATVTIDAPVANENYQWGGVKAMFK